MLKLFLLILFLIPFSVYGSQYDNEIEALLLFQRYQNKNDKGTHTKKEYLSTPINNCSSIIKVKNNKIIKSYEVNICDKEVFQI